MVEDKEREAGRSLDAEIAERVMGWRLINNLGAAGGRLWQGHGGGFGDMWEGQQPEFSSEIAPAFQVVEAMRAKGWRYRVSSGYNAEHLAEFWIPLTPNSRQRVESSTPALAICLAAIAALDASQPASRS